MQIKSFVFQASHSFRNMILGKRNCSSKIQQELQYRVKSSSKLPLRLLLWVVTIELTFSGFAVAAHPFDRSHRQKLHSEKHQRMPVLVLQQGGWQELKPERKPEVRLRGERRKIQEKHPRYSTNSIKSINSMNSKRVVKETSTVKADEVDDKSSWYSYSPAATPMDVPSAAVNGEETVATKEAKGALTNDDDIDMGKTSAKKGDETSDGGKSFSIPLAPFTLELDHSDDVTEEDIVDALTSYLRTAMRIRDEDTLTLRVKIEQRIEKKHTEELKDKKDDRISGDDSAQSADDAQADAKVYKFEGTVTMNYDKDPGFTKSIQQSLLWRRQRTALVEEQASLEQALISVLLRSDQSDENTSSTSNSTSPGTATSTENSGSHSNNTNSTNNNFDTNNSTVSLLDTNSSTTDINSTALASNNTVHVVQVDMSKVVGSGGNSAGFTEKELAEGELTNINGTVGGVAGSGTIIGDGGNSQVDHLSQNSSNDERIMKRQEIVAIIVSTATLLVLILCCMLKLIKTKWFQNSKRNHESDEDTADNNDVDLERNKRSKGKTSSPEVIHQSTLITPKQQFWANLSRMNNHIRTVQISSKQCHEGDCQDTDLDNDDDHHHRHHKNTKKNHKSSNTNTTKTKHQHHHHNQHHRDGSPTTKQAINQGEHSSPTTNSVENKQEDFVVDTGFEIVQDESYDKEDCVVTPTNSYIT